MTGASYPFLPSHYWRLQPPSLDTSSVPDFLSSAGCRESGARHHLHFLSQKLMTTQNPRDHFVPKTFHRQTRKGPGSGRCAGIYDSKGAVLQSGPHVASPKPFVEVNLRDSDHRQWQNRERLFVAKQRYRNWGKQSIVFIILRDHRFSSSMRLYHY